MSSNVLIGWVHGCASLFQEFSFFPTSVETFSNTPWLFNTVSDGFVKPLKASEYAIVLCRYVCEDRYGGIITQERSRVKH